MAGRRALVVATYAYADRGLSRLAAPAHDAESFAAVLQDPAIAGFDVTMLVDQPHHVVGEAIADFYAGARRDDLTLLYFTGHGVKDDEGRLYLAMNNTRREALMFTAISAAQLNDAMDASTSRRKVLILDCCYSGAFPAGRTPKSDEGVHTLERFQGKGRAVLTASDATQYAFEGDDVSGSGTSSVFTRHLVEAISSGAADLDDDGDIALDELYSYVYERVVAELPQQRPKKQEDVDGRILLARNVHWTLPSHLRHAIASPIAGQRLEALQQLEHLHAAGNGIVRAAVTDQVVALAADDSRSVSSAAVALLERIGSRAAVVPAGETIAPQAGTPAPPPPPLAPPSAPPPPPAARARGDAGTGGSGTAAPGALPGAPSRPQGPSVRVLLARIALAGALLLLARSLTFESTYDQRAADVGVPWWLWLIGAGLPLLVAAQLLLLRGTEAWTLAVAGGLVAGAALSQLEMVLRLAAWSMDADTDEQPGPGWWVQLGAAVVLIACVVLMLRSPVFRGRPGPRSDWRAVAALLMVIAALVAQLDAYRDFWVLLAGIEPALLLAAACLPLVVLDLSPAQRWFGLVAVTVLGMWVVATPVRELMTDSLPVDTRTAVVSVIAGLVSVAACWLAQWRPPRRRARPEGVLAESR